MKASFNPSGYPTWPGFRNAMAGRDISLTIQPQLLCFGLIIFVGAIHKTIFVGVNWRESPPATSLPLLTSNTLFKLLNPIPSGSFDDRIHQSRFAINTNCRCQDVGLNLAPANWPKYRLHRRNLNGVDMDFVFNLRFADHFTPGLDLAGDEDFIEGFFGNT